jgi:hypothetical protein
VRGDCWRLPKLLLTSLRVYVEVIYASITVSFSLAFPQISISIPFWQPLINEFLRSLLLGLLPGTREGVPQRIKSYSHIRCTLNSIKNDPYGKYINLHHGRLLPLSIIMFCAQLCVSLFYRPGNGLSPHTSSHWFCYNDNIKAIISLSHTRLSAQLLMGPLP